MDPRLTEKAPVFVWFDLETTGLNKVDDRIIEIGAVIDKTQRDHFKWKGCRHRFSSLVRNTAPLDAKITELTGIEQQMLQDQPEIQEALPKFKKWLVQWQDLTGRSILMVAHNANFDWAFLTNANIRLNKSAKCFIPNVKFSCSMISIREGYGRLTNLSLEKLAKQYISGFSSPQSHRALEDAQLLQDLANAMPEFPHMFNELLMNQFE